MKTFNTTAVCKQDKHYMVDITERIKKIRALVEAGKYFIINRARQYGKTTTLNALADSLNDECIVLSISLEGIGKAGLENENVFVKEFCRLLRRETISDERVSDEIKQEIDLLFKRTDGTRNLGDLFDVLLDWCCVSEKEIVLLIDEVDKAIGFQVFLDFLSQLRYYYIERDTKGIDTIKSVVLAGVTDIKHLKAKICPDEDAKVNSPWNIAADFNIDMSLSEDGIKGMLNEYEADHSTGMDTAIIAKLIRDYTSGYPFLVSRICQIIDEQFVPERFENLSEAWTETGVMSAIKVILAENNTLFGSIMGKLQNTPNLSKRLKDVLFSGDTIPHLPDNPDQQQLRMYGFIVNDHNTVAIANRIFEMRLYNYFIGESRFSDEMRGDALDHKPEFIKGGELNIPLIMERFIETQKYIRDMNNEEAEKKFIESEGREKFLTYLSPIINGVGTFSVEEQTRDRRRMDIVIHYRGRRYIIELKIWHGDRYNEKGEEQIVGYLEHFGLDTGYLLSFSFNKDKIPGVKKINIGSKILYEGIV